MNYLIIEGFQTAAINFAHEAQINPQIDLDSIRERNRIRHAIHEGSIQSAVEMINDLNPEVSLHDTIAFTPVYLLRLL